MYAGVVGSLGSVAAGQLQQARTADVDRATQDVLQQARSVDANERTEKAAGIGEMEQEEGASERDADGRRLWEQQSRRPRPSQSDPSSDDSGSSLGQDPTGEAGTQLDLSG